MVAKDKRGLAPLGPNYLEILPCPPPRNMKLWSGGQNRHSNSNHLSLTHDHTHLLAEQLHINTLKLVQGFPVGSEGKESACSVGDLDWEEPSEKRMATHSSILFFSLIFIYF